MHKPRLHIFVCRRHRDPAEGKPSCDTNGSEAVLDAFKQEIATRNLWGEVQLTGSHCLGYCYQGPIVVVYPEGVWYEHVYPSDVPRIFTEHLLGGQPVKDKLLT